MLNLTRNKKERQKKSLLMQEARNLERIQTRKPLQSRELTIT